MLESFFNIVAGFQVHTFIKKRLQQKYFSNCEIFKSVYFEEVCERLVLNSVATNFSSIWRLQNRCSYKCFLTFAKNTCTWMSFLIAGLQLNPIFIQKETLVLVLSWQPKFLRTTFFNALLNKLWKKHYYKKRGQI